MTRASWGNCVGRRWHESPNGERERERERKTDRQADRERERERERNGDKEMGSRRDGKGGRKTHTQKEEPTPQPV